MMALSFWKVLSAYEESHPDAGRVGCLHDSISMSQLSTRHRFERSYRHSRKVQIVLENA